MAAFLSSSRRHSSHLLRCLSPLRLRHGHGHVETEFSTAAAATATISAAAAKNRIRNVFDPDEAMAILSTTSPTTTSSSQRFAYDLTVRRLARCGRTDEVVSLLSARKAQLPADEHSIAPLIATYGSAGLLSHARQLFDEIPQPTSLSFNALLRAHAIAKQPKLIPELFESLPAQHPSLVPDHISYGILLKSLCIVGRLDDASKLFDEMQQKHNIPPTVPLYTTLIDSLYKKKCAEEAEKLWSDMLAKDLKPDHVLYNVRIMHSSELGKPEEVLGLIKEMETAGWKPDAISRNYLISAYCRSKRFEDAKEAYKEFMTKKGSFGGPNAAIFRDFVKFLCGNGDFDGGLEVVKDSMKFNKIPDFKTMKVLVKGLMAGGKVEEVKEVVRVVKKRFPDELLGGWKSLEKELGLVPDGDAAEPVEVEATPVEVEAEAGEVKAA